MSILPEMVNDASDTMTTHEDLIVRMADSGFMLFPCYGISSGVCGCGRTDCASQGKHPIIGDPLNRASNDQSQVREWLTVHANANWAVACQKSGLVVVDVDPRHEGHTSLITLDDRLSGEFPATVEVTTGAYRVGRRVIRGQHFYLLCDDDVSMRANLDYAGLPGIDIKHNGYVIVPGSNHLSGVKYEWKSGRALGEVPLVRLAEPLLGVLSKKRSRSAVRRAFARPSHRDPFVGITDRIDVAQILRDGIDEGARAVDIHRMACSLGNKFGTDPLSRELIEDRLLRFNEEKVRPPLDPEELLGHVRGALDFVAENPLFGTGVNIAASDSPDFGAGKATPRFHRGLTDSEVAEWIGRIHLRDRFCWVSGLDWMVFDGRRWERCPEPILKEEVRKCIKRLWMEAMTEGVGDDVMAKVRSFLSGPKIGAVSSLIKGISARDAKSFDQHPSLLNVGNGVVDLKTGEMLPHSPHYLFTKLTETPYAPTATHRDWIQAVAALDPQTVDYIQQRLGQALSGNTPPDDVMIWLRGAGANGKSTFVAGVKSAAGEHMAQVPDKVLTANPMDHPTELMTLRGVRLAYIEELPEGESLSVRRLKSMVGTPEMTAREIRRDNVTWKATHALVATTNHLPKVKETDHGTWRRLQVIPFEFRFVTDGDESGPGLKVGDPQLRDRLQASEDGQAEAVLAWLVEGSLRFHAAGECFPDTPKAVVEATREWRGRDDVITRYLSDVFELDPAAYVEALALYDHCRAWSLADEGLPFPNKAIVQRLMEHDWVLSGRLKKRRMDIARGAAGTVERTMVWQGLKWRESDGAT